VPIVSISQIKNRRGNLEDLPQFLASGELGWAIDRRRLFIGNGTLEEGAPDVGNTEILTEFSDIIDLLDTYTYKGSRVGYIADTGGNGSSVVRSLQDRLDETVNILSYGVVSGASVSDAIAEDNADAINRALRDLYCIQSNPDIRRVLFFPAGVYRIKGDVIKVPSYASIIGEGSDCTIILQEDDNQDSVLELADSQQEIGANQGSVTSRYIDVRDITFSTLENIDVLRASTALQCRFSRVKFQGGLSSQVDLGTGGNANACARINQTTDYVTSNLVFSECEFTDNSFGVIIDNKVRSIKFNNCYFHNHYSAMLIGDNSTAPDQPQGVSVTYSLFDNIYASGIYGVEATGVTSAFNTYLDVGVGFLGINSNTAVSPVVEFDEDGNASFNDYFARNDTAALDQPRVELNGKANYSLVTGEKIQHGYLNLQPGKTVTLSNDTSVADNTGISIDSSVADNLEISYKITRDDQIRVGVIRIACDDANQDFSEDFVENNGGIGVTFSLDHTAGTTSLQYTTTNTGDDAVMRYQVRYFI